jgi:hypothetical protein
MKFILPLFILLVSRIASTLPINSKDTETANAEEAERKLQDIYTTILISALLNGDIHLSDLNYTDERSLLHLPEGNVDGKASTQFVKSEPIVETKGDGNFTIAPPERPVSAPPFPIDLGRE